MQSSLGALVVVTLELPTDSSSSLQLLRRFVFAANSAAWGGALEGIMYRQSVMHMESLIMPIRIGPVRKAKKTTEVYSNSAIEPEPCLGTKPSLAAT